MMTADLRDSPQSPGTVSRHYRRLLGQYTRNQKQKIKKDRQLINNLREARKGVSEPNRPEEPEEGFWPINLDLFGNQVVNSGGIAILESMFMLDEGTLAALIEWNRINLLRMEQMLFIRRSVVFVIAGLSIVASLDKLHVFGNRIVIGVLRLYGGVLLQNWWLNILGITGAVVLGVVVWRPGKEVIEVFGQMLAVALAYVSKTPSTHKDKTPIAHKEKTKEGPEEGQASTHSKCSESLSLCLAQRCAFCSTRSKWISGSRKTLSLRALHRDQA